MVANVDEFEPEVPETSWISVGGAPDRDMILLRDFTYWDRKGKAWRAPIGTEIDGASIPQPLWSIAGSPYTGDYRRASILHDVACRQAQNHSDRRKADFMYFCACRKGGCSLKEAVIQYIGVSIGGWLPGLRYVDVYEKPIDRRGETEQERADRELAANIIVGTFNELWGGVKDFVNGADDEDYFTANIEKEVDRQLDLKTEQLQQAR